MNYRRLGNSGLKVSEISLGSWLTYGGYVGREEAISTIDKAYELGINFFDTANIYMNGEAEKVVGEALRKYPRESYVLATKVWGPMGDRPNDRGLSRKHIMEQCEASLKRLGLDYIDVYYCHAFDNDTPMEETLRAMDDLVRQGKVLYVGISNWTAAQIAEAVSIMDKYLLHRIVANQPLYNMFAREIEKEIIPLCERNGIGQVVYSPLAQGVLAGKYRTVNDAPAGSRASDKHGNQTVKSWLKEENLRKVERLRPIAEELGLSLAQLALAWTLRQPNVSSAIIGASVPEQVEHNVKASGVTIPDETLATIDEILEQA
ncbi:aldo/keto reductase family protein [Brevibacillus thermoruber]|uniref:Aldo/keto reductase family protein n=1 Tax=Brevibacillus thermoruber TaxID=33942 RepID=A0A9X3Z2X9_9BACL|nr:aldo/keto reductase family protein [Brevibacillus thermoruber]MDA5108094.1 aldo/keto reductase family protein [Brevibacillus thermoruber]